MKNTQKGFAPIVIALIVAIVLGGGYAVVKTNPGLAKKLGFEKQVEKKETNTSEISVRGVVVDNNLENQNIGAYLQIKRSDGAGDIFVVYKPFVDMKESPCLNKIEAYTIGVGTSIEVKGLKIEDMNGIKPKGLVISTCESEGYYIREVSDETVNWKTYKNEQYGFSIQYPSGTEINDHASIAKIFFQPSTTKGSLSIELSQPELNCYDGITSGADPSYKTIDGASFMVWSLSKELSTGSDTWATARLYCAIQNGNKYEIFSKLPYKAGTTPLDVDKDLVLNQMIASFKFTTPAIATTKEKQVLATAREVLKVLAARDHQTLEGLVSPEGLSLSQSPGLDFVHNLIPKNDVSEISKDIKVYFWGYTDGRGDDINLTRAEFLTKYIYSGKVDYLKAPDVLVNKTKGTGNTPNYIDKSVKGRTYVSFHFDGFDPKYGGMDWTTIYIVFDLVNGEYKLRGIAKDNWTI